MTTVLPRTIAEIERGIDAGLHLGVQLYVSLHGVPVADLGIGSSRAGVPMTSETVVPWFSSSKPIGAVALARLWELEALDLDDRVAAFLPEFAAGGKEAVTLRHLLTHTGGFRRVDDGWPEASWEETIARICAAPLEAGWVPGRDAGYHVSSSWFILGEVIRRLDGRPYERYAREGIFEPLGMTDSWVAMPPERYRAYGGRIGLMHRSERGRLEPHPFGFDSERAAAAPNPAGGARGPAHDLGRFYEMLLARGRLDGARILTAQTVEALTSPHRVGLRDRTFEVVLDWGLGFLVDSKRHGADPVPYGFGPHASPRTFGHGGSESSIGFADPDAGLVVAWVANGMPGHPRHNARNRAINAAIYEDLGLATPGHA